MIFYLHLNPVFSAEYLGDNHIKDQIPYITELMSHVYLLPGANISKPDVHVEMEVLDKAEMVWITRDLKNWLWCMMHLYGLHEQYEKRFGEQHPDKHLMFWLADVKHRPSAWIRYSVWSDPPPLNPNSRKEITLANREFYYKKFRSYHNYTNVKTPDWLKAMYMQEVNELIDKCELELVDPDKHRPEDITDSVWEDIKFRAKEVVNGRMENE